jgi:quercetin dioxygenase-like cupin family protein
MKLDPFVVTPQNYRQPLDVVGVQVTVLATNDATKGYEITVQEGPEGAGPVRHTHPREESFYVLRGRVDIDCDGEIIAAEHGTLVHFPAGTAHGYRFGAGGGAMLEISGPGGLATKMFELISNANVNGPADLPKLVPVFERIGAAIAT